MRFDISDAIYERHPGIEDHLWRIAVISKQADPDIKLMGLWVRVQRHADDIRWNGWAHPEEQSELYGKQLIHPSGRIDLRVGDGIAPSGVTRLFAHELRHIGQFHRCRQETGYLGTEHLPEAEVEPDCYAFEELVLKKIKEPKCKWPQEVSKSHLTESKSS